MFEYDVANPVDWIRKCSVDFDRTAPACASCHTLPGYVAMTYCWRIVLGILVQREHYSVARSTVNDAKISLMSHRWLIQAGSQHACREVSLAGRDIFEVQNMRYDSTTRTSMAGLSSELQLPD